MNGSNRNIGESFVIICGLWHNQHALLVMRNPNNRSMTAMPVFPPVFEAFV